MTMMKTMVTDVNDENNGKVCISTWSTTQKQFFIGGFACTRRSCRIFPTNALPAQSLIPWAHRGPRYGLTTPLIPRAIVTHQSMP